MSGQFPSAASSIKDALDRARACEQLAQSVHEKGTQQYCLKCAELWREQAAKMGNIGAGSAADAAA
jgi:hypothetical protein